MKIAQIMPEFGLAGAEIMCENLTYELVNAGHEVVVVSMYDYHSAITERLEAAGVEIRYLGKKPGMDPSMILKMYRVFRETGVQVVHTHRYCAQYAMPAAMLAGVKHRVHTLHSVAPKENKRMARKLSKFFYHHCNLIPVSLSELVRESVVEEYKLATEAIPMIFNGINLSKCLPKADYAREGNFKILHIGRFSQEKNHIGLLTAFRKFHHNHPDSELWLIGDGPIRPDVEAFAREQGLEQTVKFLGLQSNVYGFMHDADVFALTSNYEGMPMTLIEAMGTGMPIVATRVGGIPDMLDDDSALLVPLDMDQVAEAFEQYYCDEELRRNRGQEAAKHAVRFSAKAMAENYLKLYSM